VIFQEKLLKVLKCYNFLWVQRRRNCSPATSFANCVMTLYLLKVHLRTFLSIPIIQKCQILSCDTLVANERYVHVRHAARINIWTLLFGMCLMNPAFAWFPAKDWRTERKQRIHDFCVWKKKDRPTPDEYQATYNLTHFKENRWKCERAVHSESGVILASSANTIDALAQILIHLLHLRYPHCVISVIWNSFWRRGA